MVIEKIEETEKISTVDPSKIANDNPSLNVISLPITKGYVPNDFFEEESDDEIVNPKYDKSPITQNEVFEDDKIVLKRILSFNVAQFQNYASKDNPNWINNKYLEEIDKNALLEIINYSGLSKISIPSIVDFYQSGKYEILRIYSNTFRDKSLDNTAIFKLEEIDRLEVIELQIDFLRYLIKDIKYINIFMDYRAFVDFLSLKDTYMKYREVRKDFMIHSRIELRSLYLFLKACVGYNIKKLAIGLPTIVSLHKFSKECLIKLNADFVKNDKPLTILLYPTDDNGAFIRTNDIKEVILNPNINVIVVEGTLIAAKFIETLIKMKGKDGKLAQLMIAGHGTSISINILEQTNNATNKLIVGNEKWKEVFKMIKCNMSGINGQSGIFPKVLLDACQVASHNFHFDDNLQSKIDDTLQDQEKAAAINELKTAIGNSLRNKNLLSFVTEIFAQIPVLGAYGSIKSDVKLIDKTGNLCLQNSKGNDISTRDSYIENGSDAIGVLSAMVEAWVLNNKENMSVVTMIRKRRSDSPISILINTLLNIININFDRDPRILLQCYQCAQVLQPALTGGKINFKALRTNKILSNCDLLKLFMSLVKALDKSPHLQLLLIQLQYIANPDENIDEFIAFLNANNTNLLIYEYLDLEGLSPFIGIIIFNDNLKLETRKILEEIFRKDNQK